MNGFLHVTPQRGHGRPEHVGAGGLRWAILRGASLRGLVTLLLLACAATVSVSARAEGESSRVMTVHFPEAERERIRQELREELRKEIREAILQDLNPMLSTDSSRWVLPEASGMPDWVSRIRFSGEFLLRGQAELLGDNNDPAINFHAINAGAPVDIFLPTTGTPQKVLTIPYLNTTENRNSLKLGAKLGMDTSIERYDIGLRLSTGSSSNPVSTSQTLGNEFNKMSFVLDRAWLRYRLENHIWLSGGRMANPWEPATDLLWDSDLGFDGLSLRMRSPIAGRINPLLVAGAFSIANTETNYPSLSPFKEGSRDKWIFGAQFGIQPRLFSDLKMVSKIGYYDFTHVQGEMSASCYAPTDKVPCSTDYTRPGFAQKGNTLMALRQLNRPNPASDPEFQYFGLVSPFRIAELALGFEKPLSFTTAIRVDFAYTRNLAFDAASIAGKSPVNNLALCPLSNPNCAPVWQGGGDAWQAQVRLGWPEANDVGRWDAVFGYRYVESDAVVDAFTDSDFHLGGTNAQGFYLGGSLGLAPKVSLGARLLSAREVAGWRYAADMVQINLRARF